MLSEREFKNLSVLKAAEDNSLSKFAIAEG
jgi:hypothetical protein